MVLPRLLRSPEVISLHQLIACGVAPTSARTFVEPLNKAVDRFKISNAAMFIAQGKYESSDFTRLEENLYYSDPIRLARDVFRGSFDLDQDQQLDPEEVEFAKRYIRQPVALGNRVYANRLGNGDEASGDGFKYRGRGIFQLTGRSSYVAAGEALGIDLGSSPGSVAQPEMACMTAGWYWASAGLNQWGEQLTVEMATRKINGPKMLGLNERRLAYNEARDALMA
jgi:putative chitinase